MKTEVLQTGGYVTPEIKETGVVSEGLLCMSLTNELEGYKLHDELEW